MSVDRTLTERRPGDPPLSTQPRRRVTPEEYLETERSAETKSEYYNGEMFAMSGASGAHNLIVANLVTSLVTQTRGRPCFVYPGDLRVKVQRSGMYTYPDVSVVCGQPQLEDLHLDTLLNPTLLVEVLSASTVNYDLGLKAELYRGLDSLQDLLLVSQDRPHLQRYQRESEREWRLTDFRGLEETVGLASIGCTLALRESYDKVLT